MIVVAIIAFLATISVPKYFNYFAKARQAEVAVTLASLHTAQQAHYAQHGTYSNVLWGENGIGWRPEGYKGGGKQENFTTLMALIFLEHKKVFIILQEN